MLRREIQELQADLTHRRMADVRRAIDWHPMSSMPDEMKDGRYILFWERKMPVVGYWCDRSVAGSDRSFWSTGFASIEDDDLIALESPTHWAEIHQPNLGPAVSSAEMDFQAKTS